MRAAALAVVAGGFACGSSSFVLRVESTRSEVTTTEFRSEVERVARSTVRFYGYPLSDLEGIVIVFVDGSVPCLGQPSGYAGCAYFAERRIVIGADKGPLELVIGMVAHEVLHLLIRDPDHTRPEWLQLPALLRSLYPDVDSGWW